MGNGQLAGIHHNIAPNNCCLCPIPSFIRLNANYAITLMESLPRGGRDNLLLPAIKLEASLRYCNNHIVETKPQTY